MGVIKFFDLITQREDGTSVKVEFMLYDKNLWMLPQNASWDELQQNYIEAKKALKEDRVFPKEKKKDKIKPEKKKSFWSKIF